MMEHLVQWWSNPFTAALVACVLWAPVTLLLTGTTAIVRLGAIHVGGLLAQRRNLLPGYPRRAESYANLILFLLILTSLVLALFFVAVARACQLSGGDLWLVLVVGVSGFLLAVGIAVLTARGARSEMIALVQLGALRPGTPLLVLLARSDPEEETPTQDEEEVDDHEVQAFIGAGEEAGILEREDAELIASIVDLSETIVRQIMTPRTDVIAVPDGTEFELLQRTFADTLFTRLPVFRETLDRIEGVVHVKDVLKATVAGARPSAGDLLRPVLMVPETKELRELLREFQTTRQQLAVVVDEYGGTSGIVTLEDVLEEIVGEIQDEHQREAPEVEPQADGSFLVAGSAHVEVLEELFGVEVGEAGFDSVAGLVLDRLGHLPKLGEKVRWHDVDLEVVELDRRRLRRVRLRRVDEPEP
ncbi:MAG: HlyC/CorC family transporter [Thermoanaerobaculaceae bacterium]|nr:HlyC/CorC family transporter [Thermoanaerobaculaceae bacterium]MDI9621042.1 hemolysin family protein [Acidobacteriota bacterium]NLH11030.1 HlyC/CorC family transporter [Holophagae bacterium]HPW55843.1 hemolysin family protein [Thermoanaerobaculaceae bacterium]